MAWGDGYGGDGYGGGAVGFGDDFGSGSLDGKGAVSGDVGGGGFSSSGPAGGGGGGGPFDDGWGYMTDRSVPGYYDGNYREADLARASRDLTGEAMRGGFGESNRTMGQRFSDFVANTTPQAALAGLAGFALTGNPLVGALAYKGVDAAFPRGSFSGVDEEDPNAEPGFFSGMFDGGFSPAGAGLGDPVALGGVPGARAGFTNPLGNEGDGGALGGVSSPRPDTISAPVDVTPPPPETPAADPRFAMPELLYGPYFNRATGRYDAPGRNPHQSIIDRYVIERAGI